MDQKIWEMHQAIYKAKRCAECPYGKEVTDQGKHWGWSCHHPDITNQRGLMYGRYHQIESRKPRWCPATVESEGDEG